MTEYVERKKLEETFDNADPDVCESNFDGYSEWGFGRENVRNVIRSVPAADVAPVVHGRWIKKWDLYDKGFYISRKVWYECSNCGMKTHYKDESFEKEVGYNYCPNCGAKMRQEDL